MSISTFTRGCWFAVGILVAYAVSSLLNAIVDIDAILLVANLHPSIPAELLKPVLDWLSLTILDVTGILMGAVVGVIIGKVARKDWPAMPLGDIGSFIIGAVWGLLYWAAPAVFADLLGIWAGIVEAFVVVLFVLFIAGLFFYALHLHWLDERIASVIFAFVLPVVLSFILVIWGMSRTSVEAALYMNAIISFTGSYWAKNVIGILL